MPKEFLLILIINALAEIKMKKSYISDKQKLNNKKIPTRMPGLELKKLRVGTLRACSSRQESFLSCVHTLQ